MHYWFEQINWPYVLLKYIHGEPAGSMLLLLRSFPKKEVNACIITRVNYVSLFSRLPLALSLSNIEIYLYFFTNFQETRITIVIIPLRSSYYSGLRSIITSY